MNHVAHAARLIALSATALLASLAAAADPLYLQPPYDEITLDESNAGVVLRVKAIDLPGRKLPSAANRPEELEIELVDRPGERFALPWMNVVGIKFFEQLVVAEADLRVKEGKFDEALPYFSFLEAKYPQTAGLKESVENFLWQQTLAAFRQAKHDETLALLVELHGRNPQRPGLDNAWQRVTIELVKAHLTEQNYLAARGLLENLGERFPEFKETTVAPYQAQLQAQAAALVAQAQAAQAAGKFRPAHEAVSQALDVWPAIAGGRELALALHAKYPVVAVAVSAPAAAGPLHRLDDWAAVRTARLLGRPLAGPAPAGAEGGPFQSPLGELSRGEDSRQLVLKIAPDLKWSDPPRSLTGADVARGLLSLADPQSVLFDPVWADMLAGAQARGRGEVEILLRRPQPLAEAWLGVPLVSGSMTCGPYQRDSQSTPSAAQPPPARQVVRYVRQPGYFAGVATQPSEIIERTYRESAAALRALRSGEVSVVARVSPWDVARFAAASDVTLGQYAVPTVHVLVPNPGKPLANHRTLRRAILYALDREAILRRGLLAGSSITGCEVLSGPFPRGAASDEYAYAYDDQVEVRPYEPGTALVLARLAIDETPAEPTAAADKPPTLTLVHPPSPVARAACQSIARQLQLIGLGITIREQTADPAADWDLRYAELTIREPAVDVWRVLGPHGAAGTCSPAMLAALRSLGAAATKDEAAANLHKIHRLAAAELPVIPLWQLTEHFAHHASVQGLGERPATLYDQVEKWQAQPRIPAP